MKKAVKISGVILGVIMIIALVIFIFFPGIFTYFKVKHKYSHIDDSLEKFEKLIVPDAFDAFTINGVKLKMPYGSKRQTYDLTYSDGSTRPEYSNIIRYKDEISVMITQNSISEQKKLLEQAEQSGSLDNLKAELGDDYWEDFSDDEYKHYFDSVGDTVPRDDGSRVFYTKDKLKASDCLHLRGRDMEIFKYLAECKDDAYEAEKSYILDISNCKAYISQDFLFYNGKLWTVFIYPKYNEDIKYFAIIRGDDEEMIKQIISSIELKGGTK